jgi:flagellar biosynthesis/type III secretory pathway protein FliH
MAIIDENTQKLIADAYERGLDKGRQLGYAEGYEDGVEEGYNDFEIQELETKATK